jgi:hypothetical protein
MGDQLRAGLKLDPVHPVPADEAVRAAFANQGKRLGARGSKRVVERFRLWQRRVIVQQVDVRKLIADAERRGAGQERGDKRRPSRELGDDGARQRTPPFSVPGYDLLALSTSALKLSMSGW